MNGLMALRILEKMDIDELEKCAVRLYDSDWVKEIVEDAETCMEDGDERIGKLDRALEGIDDVELAGIASAAVHNDSPLLDAYLDEVERNVVDELLARAEEGNSSPEEGKTPRTA